jgi:hypothetical protein
MDPVLGWMRLKQKEITAFLRELVECESPSDDAAAVNRMGELFAERVTGLAKVKRINGGASM